MKNRISKFCYFVVLLTGLISQAKGDLSGLIQTDANSLSPLQTLQITVYDVNDFCMITVTNPNGIVHTFSGQVQDNQATASYIPSYLPGIYQIFAETTGPVPVTETDTFQVDIPSDSLAITNWQCDSGTYLPGQDLTFTFDLSNAAGPGSGFSKQSGDTVTNSDSGRLSILRKIISVAEDGSATARLFLYFDTTGSWSNIYAGTEIRIGIYNTDGSTPLNSQIIRTAGFENNDAGHLSTTLTDTLWTVYVDTGFSGSDKIAYLDFEVPPAHSISDILVSVNYIKYNYNTGWNDRIYIREEYISTSSSGMVLDTGSNFSSLGRFPIYLPMTPNENGLLYYAIHADHELGDNNINNGSVSETSGTYTNIWQWEDYINTTARVYVYADKWGYTHDFSDAITLTREGSGNLPDLIIHDFSVNPAAYLPGEGLNFSFTLTDETEVSVTGFTGTTADPVPNNTGGAMYILRKFLDADPNGSSAARLYVYFDTTGSWSNIYTGTIIEMSLYNRDGVTPLTGEIALTTGFLNNDDSKLDSVLAGNQWTVNVIGDFSGNDKIAYLDFSIPPDYSVSDIVFSVDYIKYNRNSGWGDTIYITTASAGESNFPKNLDGQIEFIEGDPFPNLGRFPVKLTLNPNPSGFIFYDLYSPDIPENNINYGSLSSSGNGYHNNFTWNDYLITTAQVFPYADGCQYANHAVGTPVTLEMDNSPRTLDIFDYALDHWGYTLAETRQFSASVNDAVGNPQNNLTFKESISDSTSGKMTIISRNAATDPNGCNIVQLLIYFDTTGSWSDIYAGTRVKLSVYGPDGKTGIPSAIHVTQGSDSAEGYITSNLTQTDGVYSWDVEVTTGFTGADRQVWLDFSIPEPNSASQIIYAVDSIKYNCNGSWADSIKIKDVTLSMGSFPTNYYGQYEFITGNKFGALGRFPLYLSLNPGQGSIYPMMITTENTTLNGTMSVSSGRYTYSHTMNETGKDYQTKLCVSKYGYMNNESLCTDPLTLFFTGEPRYLGGLNSGPIMLNEIWQKNLHEHFFIQEDYSHVQYTSSDPNIAITDNIAVFAPLTTDDTVENVIITAQSTTDPNLIAWSDPITLIAADCMESYDCNDEEGRPTACINYQCQAYDSQNSYHSHAQGVDLCVFNKNVNIGNPFPDPNETVMICAEIQNTGTTNIFDVVTNFYLDDVNSVPIDSNSVTVLPTTYLDLPFRAHGACILWTVPPDLQGQHRIWVEVTGRYPLDMEEDMLSNNYATIDFFVHDPGMLETDPAAVGDCPSPDTMLPQRMPMMLFNTTPQCQTMTMLIPIKVQVCEEETLCGPVTGYELGYWSTLYWPSWSGYCQEFNVPQEFITDLIRTYEKIYGLSSQGAASELPSWTDIPGLFEPPDGWSDGWLPCHPEPTMFWPGALYPPGVMDPGCGGLCPVSAWDCGQGVSFQPRFSSPLYHAYEYVVFGGAKKITRCHTEIDYLEIPYQICYTPGDDTPFHIPFTPFTGGPAGPGGCCYGPNGPAGPSSGPGGGPPIEFTLAGPPMDQYGHTLPFEVTFCSSGTAVSNEQEDTLLIVPNGGGPEAGILLQRGWNQFTPLLEPIEEMTDRRITLKSGWNFFGYSSMTPLLWSDALIENGEQEMSIEQAHNAGWIQGVVYTLDYETLLYQLIPGDDDFLRNKRAYWLYADQPGLTLKLPAAGGTAEGTSVAWQEMLVVNGGESKTVEEAALAGWIDPEAYFVDPNTPGYNQTAADANQIHAWQGYWLWSNISGLHLLTPEQQAHQQALAAQSRETTISYSLPTIVLQEVQNVIEEGQAAPDFTLMDTNKQSVSLTDFRGKDVLLVFGNERCPYCSAKISLLNQLQTDGNFEVIYVALGATLQRANQFVQDKNIRFTVLVDSNQYAGRTYNISSIPEAFIIDADGILQLMTQSEGQALWYLLEGKAVPDSTPSSSTEIISY